MGYAPRLTSPSPAICFVLICPESPTWYLSRGEAASAGSALIKLRQSDPEFEVESALMAMWDVRYDAASADPVDSSQTIKVLLSNPSHRVSSLTRSLPRCCLFGSGVSWCHVLFWLFSIGLVVQSLTDTRPTFSSWPTWWTLSQGGSSHSQPSGRRFSEAADQSGRPQCSLHWSVSASLKWSDDAHS